VKKLHAELHSLGGMGGKKFDLSAPTNYDNADVKSKRKQLGDFIFDDVS